MAKTSDDPAAVEEDQLDRLLAEEKLNIRPKNDLHTRVSPRVFSPLPGAADSNNNNNNRHRNAMDDDRLPQPIHFFFDATSPAPRMPPTTTPPPPQVTSRGSHSRPPSRGPSSDDQQHHPSHHHRSGSGRHQSHSNPRDPRESSDEYPFDLGTLGTIEGPTNSDFYGRSIPVPAALAATASPEVLSTYFQPSRAPSALLSTVVEAVLFARGHRGGAASIIPTEIVEAFDMIIYEGAYLIKYNTHGAPHERFFAIRMVEVSGVSREPCITWSVHKTSWSAKGAINLAELLSVVDGTVDCPAFERHLVDAFHIKGPMFGGPRRATLSTEFTVQLLGGAEPLALLGLNGPVFKAWVMFLKYIARLGRSR